MACARMRYRRFAILIGLCLLVGQFGCSSITFPIRGVPARRLPAESRGEAKRDFKPLEVTALTQPEPAEYRLAPGDVLSIYVPGVLPFQSPLSDPQLPPIHYPLPGSDLQPSVGLPVVVQESGKITLPSLPPVDVLGMTIEEAADVIRRHYLAKEVLGDADVHPVVNLIRPRTYQVTVIREDTGQSGFGNDHSAMGMTVNLPAYRNDVLGALVASGGLPGLAAKNEIRIYRRSTRRQAGSEGSHQRSIPINPPLPFTPLPGMTPDARVLPPKSPPGKLQEETLTGGFEGSTGSPKWSQMIESERLPASSHRMADIDQSLGEADLVIPLRIPIGTELELPPEAITLNSGDIIFVANRQTEVFYTAGLLPGGEHRLPRDYDVDVFAAMAIAGYSYGNPQGAGGGGGGMMPSSGIVPSQLFVFRQRPDGTQYAIRVNLARAVSNESERLLIQPGDRLLLRFSPLEELSNFGIFAFFAYGVREFLR